MLNEIKGDIFNWIKDGGIICHQTNYFGVMGAGIAAAIRHKLLSHEKYAEYVELCRMGGRTLLGHVQYLECGDGITVANCFCQDDGRASANSPNSAYTITRYYEMKRCLIDIRSKAKLEGKRVFIPYKIGCGIAGGDWGMVQSIIKDVFGKSPVDAVIVRRPGE